MCLTSTKAAFDLFLISEVRGPLMSSWGMAGPWRPVSPIRGTWRAQHDQDDVAIFEDELWWESPYIPNLLQEIWSLSPRWRWERPVGLKVFLWKSSPLLVFWNAVLSSVNVNGHLRKLSDLCGEDVASAPLYCRLIPTTFSFNSRYFAIDRKGSAVNIGRSSLHRLVSEHSYNQSYQQQPKDRREPNTGMGQSERDGSEDLLLYTSPFADASIQGEPSSSLASWFVDRHATIDTTMM